MRPADSASEVLQFIEEAKAQAWRIRIKMARTWDSHTMGTVWAMVDCKVGKLPEGIRRIHPVIGPLLSVYYEELNPKYQAEIRPAMAAWEAQELTKQEKKEGARSKGGTNATKNREGKLMVRCVKGYVEWVEINKKHIDRDSADEFQTAERIKKERLNEFLRTLITGMDNYHSDATVFATLKECKTMRTKRPKGKTWGEEEPKEKPEMHFKNVELPAVSECIKTLREAVQKKHDWTKLD